MYLFVYIFLNTSSNSNRMYYRKYHFQLQLNQVVVQFISFKNCSQISNPRNITTLILSLWFTIISSTDGNIIFIQGDGVDNGIMSWHVT